MTEETKQSLLDQLESATRNIIRVAATISLKWNRPASEIFYNDFSGFKTWITDRFEDATELMPHELPVHKCMDIMWQYSLLKRDMEKRRIIFQALDQPFERISQDQVEKDLMWPKPYYQKFLKETA